VLRRALLTGLVAASLPCRPRPRRRESPSNGITALDAVIASKVRQLAVLKRDPERFTCEAPADAIAAEGCQQMAARASVLEEELDELKERAGDGWTSEKQRAAEASAFEGHRHLRSLIPIGWARTRPPATVRSASDSATASTFPSATPRHRLTSPPMKSSVARAARFPPRCSINRARGRRRRDGGAHRRTLRRSSQRLPLPHRVRRALQLWTEAVERGGQAAYHRRAVLATRTGTERSVAAGVETMAKILAEADQRLRSGAFGSSCVSAGATRAISGTARSLLALSYNALQGKSPPIRIATLQRAAASSPLPQPFRALRKL
jgi:hypothetical protein